MSVSVIWLLLISLALHVVQNTTGQPGPDRSALLYELDASTLKRTRALNLSEVLPGLRWVQVIANAVLVLVCSAMFWLSWLTIACCLLELQQESFAAEPARAEGVEPRLIFFGSAVWSASTKWVRRSF